MARPDDTAPGGGTSGERAQVVLITGEPGSGKSTLGAELSRALRVPFIARDDVRGGLFMTTGAWSARPRGVPTSEDAVETFLHLVETTASVGVSCIAEHVFLRGREADLARLTAVADCTVLHTWSRDALARFARRNAADRLLNRQPVLDSLGYATIGDHTTEAVARMQAVAGEMRTTFDLPNLEVNTDGGYDPGIDDIVDFVIGGG